MYLYRFNNKTKLSMKHTIQEENWRERFDEKYHYQNGVELLLNSPNHSQTYDVTFGIKKFIADELASQLQSILEEVKEMNKCMCGGGFLKKLNIAHISGECRLNSKEYFQALSDVQSIISNRVGK